MTATKTLATPLISTVTHAINDASAQSETEAEAVGWLPCGQAVAHDGAERGLRQAVAPRGAQPGEAVARDLAKGRLLSERLHLESMGLVLPVYLWLF